MNGRQESSISQLKMKAINTTTDIQKCLSPMRHMMLAVLAGVTLTAFTPVNGQAQVLPPTKPLVGTWPGVGGLVRSMVVGNGVAYVTTVDAGLMVFDLSQPEAPRWLRSVDVGGLGSGLAISGHRLYLTGNTNLIVMGLEDPGNPTPLGSCALRGAGISIAVESATAYIGEGRECGSWRGLEVVDVSNSSSPVVRGAVALGGDPNTYPLKIQVSGTNLFMDAYFGGLLAFDVHDPERPQQVASIREGHTYGFEVSATGKHLYVGGADSITVVDVSHPTLPAIVGTNAIPSGAGPLTRVGSLLVVGANTGAYFLDISNPAVPTVASRLTADSLGLCAGSYSNQYYFLLNGHINYAQIVDGVDVGQPGLKGGFALGRDTRRVQVMGDRAYLADGWFGLQILDISNLSAPMRLYGRDTMDGWDVVADLWLAGTTVYTAAGGGMRIWDVGNPRSPVLLGTYPTSDAQQVQVVGTTAYLRCGFSPALHLVDVSNPSRPTRVATFGSGDIFPPPTAAVVDGMTCYFAQGATFDVVDFSVAAVPRVLGSCELPSDSPKVMVVRGSHVFVSYWGGLCVVDVAAPDNPIVLSEVATGVSNFGFDLDVAQELGFIVRDVGGGFIEAIDLHDVKNLVWMGESATASGVKGVTAGGDLFYIANGAVGLLIAPNQWLATEPVFGSGPAATEVVNGAATVFSIGVRGTPPLSFVWKKDGVSLTNDLVVEGGLATLSIPSVTPDHAGSYTLTVGNVKGTRTSDPWTLRVDAEHGLLESALQPDGAFQVSVPTAEGANYLIQTSTNLTDWVDLTTVRGTGGEVLLLDLSLTDATCYFRVLLHR